MVVHQDQRRGAEFERALDHLAGIDRGVVDRAALLALVLEQHILAVEKQDVELLDLVVRDLGAAIIDQLVPGIDHRPFLQLRPHQPQRCLAHRFDRGDPGEAEPRGSQRVGIGAQQLGKPAELLEQLLRQGLDVAARVADEQHHFQELVIGQVFRPGIDQALAQPLAVPVVVRGVLSGFAEMFGLAAADRIHRSGLDLWRERSRASAAPAIRAGSSLSKALTKQSIPRSIAAPIGNSSQSRISDFCSRTARGPAARIGRTKRSTAASSPSAGATASIRPQSSASAAPIVSPVSSSRRARPGPISFGNKAASTTEGMQIATSGMPKIELSLATRRSQAAASSSPAPRAKPSMRAMTGTGSRRNPSQQRCTRVMNLRAAAWSSAAISAMSAPPTKARPPVPVRIASRSCGSAASPDAVSTISSISAELRLLSLPGLSIVSRAIWPPSGRSSCATRNRLALI